MIEAASTPACGTGKSGGSENPAEHEPSGHALRQRHGESFFATLKLELADDRPLKDRDAARCAVFEYVEVFYNRVRMHSALDYRSPLQAEREYQPARPVS